MLARKGRSDNAVSARQARRRVHALISGLMKYGMQLVSKMNENVNTFV